MINLSLSLTKSMSYSFIWMLFVIPPFVFSAEELHRRCRQSFTCGNQNDLFYPFWNPDRENCGHPDFKVECTTGFAEFNISSVKFRILEANSTSRVFRLARSDYISNLCPQNPPNAPVNENILPFTRGTGLLTIYNGCQDFSLPNYAGEFDCDGVDRKSYYVINLLPSLPPEFGTLCNSNVRIPVSGPSLNTLKNNLNEDNLKKALEEGFEVGLNQECLMCMNSGGACGYNQTQTVSGFVCYCIDEIRNHTCGYQKKDKMSYLHFQFPTVLPQEPPLVPSLNLPTHLLIGSIYIKSL